MGVLSAFAYVFIISGILLILLNVNIVIFCLIRRKENIRQDLRIRGICGALFIFIGLIIKFAFDLNLDFSGCMISIVVGYIILLPVFLKTSDIVREN